MMSAKEVHQVVEYIRSVGVEFDAADVEEDVEGVLWQYGFYDGFSDEDLAKLKEELMPFGLEREIAEITMLVNAEGSGSGALMVGQPEVSQ